MDKHSLQINLAVVEEVEGARCNVLVSVFYEWFPEGSYDNSCQPCPSRSLTSSTSYSRTEWRINLLNGVSYHQLIHWFSGHNMDRS